MQISKNEFSILCFFLFFIIFIVLIDNSVEGKMGNKQTEKQKIKLTVVFNNISYSPELKTEWGYSCVIQTSKDTLLFDAGSNGKVLLSNISQLNIDPHSIKSVIISHAHWDHLGGLADFLQVNADVTVYIPNSFNRKIEKDIVKAGAKVVKVESFREITTNIFSLGELGEAIPEQSIAVRTSEGIVVITGCAHPGIVNIVKHARAIFSKEPIYLIMGGFHLRSYSSEKIKKIVKEIYELDVKYVAPSHCTGEKAIEIFEQIFGDNFIKSGVGKVIKIK